MRVFQSSIAAVLVVISAGCAPTGTAAPSAADVSAARSVIEATNAKFVEAMKKGDAATVAAIYADDAVLMLTGEPVMRGGPAILEGLKGMLATATITDFTVNTSDVMLAGDLAIETGTAAMTTKMKDGPEEKNQLKYLTVWKRQADGGWKIIRDIDSPGPRAEK